MRETFYHEEEWMMLRFDNRVTPEQWQAIFGPRKDPDADSTEMDAGFATIIAALESDIEALRRIIDDQAARIASLEAGMAPESAPQPVCAGDGGAPVAAGPAGELEGRGG